MTFSFKKLTFGLVAGVIAALGFVAPAQATAGITMVTSPAPTFTASSASTAFKITVDNGGTAFVSDGSPSAIQLVLDVRGTGGVTGMWSPKSGCATSFTAATSAGCGILSITGTGIVAPVVKNDFGQLAIKGLGTATSVTIDFDSAAFQTAADGGTYNLKAQTGPAWSPTSYTLALTVAAAAPTYAVNYLPNGGSGQNPTPGSSNTGSITLPSTTMTKAGYTFAGWRAGSATVGTIYQAGTSAPLSSNTNFYAQWSSNSGGSSASATLTLGASSGQLVAGSSVAVSASGLQSTASYTVTVQSTPQTIGTGNAVSGAVSTNVTLPSGLEAGWHTLTFTSTDSNGSAVTSVTYFKVSASGTLLATSSTIPAELANTGIDSTNGIMFLLGGLSLALIGAEMIMIARRKRSN